MNDSPNIGFDLIPQPAGNVEIEVVEGEVLLYQPQGTRAVYLNPTAAVIWGLCDGVRSVREITELLNKTYPDADDLINQVARTLSELQESGLVVVR